MTETADAFSAVQRTAVEAAVEQAQLRKGVSLVFRSLARRNQSLLQRQLKLLDEMERGTEDPDALEQLFRLDHLTTRMRRQAEGLIILSGAAPGRTWRQPVPVVEVLRGAIGEIEDFARVDLVTDSPDFMQGTAVADVTHLLAELIENAVQYSPPGTRVQVRGGRVANGYVIEIEDRGLGIPPDMMSTLNERLAKPPEFDLADSDQLGPLRGQPARGQARRQGLAARLRLRRHDGDRPAAADARRSRGRGPPAWPEKAAKEAAAARGPWRSAGSASSGAAARGSGRSATGPAAAAAGSRGGRQTPPAAGAPAGRRGRPHRRGRGRAPVPACRAGRPRPAWPRSCARTVPAAPRDRWRAARLSRPARSCPLSSRDGGAVAPPDACGRRRRAQRRRPRHRAWPE